MLDSCIQHGMAKQAGPWVEVDGSHISILCLHTYTPYLPTLGHVSFRYKQ